MNQKDKEKRLLNAKKANIFAGKRFLGFTPKGGEVWINMELQKDSKTLSIECSHNLNVLLQPGAKLATKRVTVKKGSSTRGTASELLRRNQKNMGGEVRPETILHMQRLISAVLNQIKWELLENTFQMQFTREVMTLIGVIFVG